MNVCEIGACLVNSNVRLIFEPNKAVFRTIIPVFGVVYINMCLHMDLATPSLTLLCCSMARSIPFHTSIFPFEVPNEQNRNRKLGGGWGGGVIEGYGAMVLKEGLVSKFWPVKGSCLSLIYNGHISLFNYEFSCWMLCKVFRKNIAN